MKVLGIDPGTHRIGWAVIQGDAIDQEALAYGSIEIASQTKSSSYLAQLNTKLAKVIHEHKPDKAGVESIFFQKNKKTAISVAQARGVILLTLAQNQVPCIELAPNTIKLAVTGSGKATKKQVETMVTTLLNLDESPKLDDTSDALATAITALTM